MKSAAVTLCLLAAPAAALVMPRTKLTKMRMEPTQAAMSPEVGAHALKIATTLRGGSVDFATIVAPAIGATIANGTMRRVCVRTSRGIERCSAAGLL